jgi:hypothetical protein
MQHGSLIRSGRKRGPDVWQFRWADRAPYGKRIYGKKNGGDDETRTRDLCRDSEEFARNLCAVN